VGDSDLASESRNQCLGEGSHGRGLVTTSQAIDSSARISFSLPRAERLTVPLIAILQRFVLLLLLSACAAPAWSSSPVATEWEHGSGRVFRHAVAPSLESGYALAQDQDGFIWLGTQSGLVRWDGYSAHEYLADLTTAGSLQDSYVRALLVDRAGTLWIGTKSGGLSRYEPRTDSFNALVDPTGIVGQDIAAMAQGTADLWIASNRGLARLDQAAGRLAAERLPANVGAIQSVMVARDATVWLGSDHGLWARRASEQEFVQVPLESPSGAASISVLRLLEDRTGNLWIGTHLHGTFTIAPGAPGISPLRVAGDADLTGDTVYALVDAGNGEIWIGTYGGGLVRVDADRRERMRERHDPARSTSLLDDDVAALLRDRSGIVWVATAYGLSSYDTRYDDVKTLHGGPGRLIRDANVPAVLATAGGRVFVATGAHGLEIIDAGSGAAKVLHSDPAHSGTSLPRARVVSMAEASNGDVWVGTQGGLYRVSADGSRVERISVPGRALTADVWALLIDGSELWLGGTDGLWELDASGAPHLAVRRHVDSELGQTQVRALAMGRDHALWIGTSGHVFRLERPGAALVQLPVDPHNPAALPGGLTSGLLVDEQGRLWVGTLGQGLQVQTGHRPDGLPLFRRITVRDGLPNNGVDALVRDADGQVWASTDDGLARIAPSTLAITSLRAAQGAGITTFWTGSATRSPDGNLMFGGEGGLLVIDPRRLQWLEGKLAPPAVTAASVGDRPIAAATLAGAEELLVPAASPRLQVEFASLAYGEQDLLRYAYRLQGFDNTWNEAPSRSRLASYTKLPPGHYRLQLRAGRPDGTWSAMREIALRVEPRWFERPEVHGVALVAALALAWTLHLWRLRHAARRQALLEHRVQQRTAELEHSRSQIQLLSSHNARSLEQERTRISRELHDEMAQQLAALRMEVSVLRLSTRPPSGGEELPVQALVDRVDAIIRSIRELVTQLRPPALDGGLCAAIEWMSAKFEQQSGIRCGLELEECAAFAGQDAATMAFRVVQESLTNVRRHSGATAVRIVLKSQGRVSCLEIIDNGVGFEIGREQTGYGLLGMQERVTALGGRLAIVSTPGQGTVVRVTLEAPADREAASASSRR
jgi:signal transduction histidine kinase/ligand-binding sensor domain-containing protein